jgi:hypothetical protein
MPDSWIKKRLHGFSYDFAIIKTGPKKTFLIPQRLVRDSKVA